jgi:hypothetical protein
MEDPPALFAFGLDFLSVRRTFSGLALPGARQGGNEDEEEDEQSKQQE